MKKQMEFFIATLVFFTIILSSCQSFATGLVNGLKAVEFSEEFKRYMEMTSEEREKVLMPRMFDIKASAVDIRNPFKLSTLVGSSSTAKYSLQETIPANMVVKNQMTTNSCWAFSSLSMLESTLALKDYKLGNTPKVYDFSERHLEYSSSSKSFVDGENTKGFNREVGAGGNSTLYIPYFTNGTGAVLESALPFESNEDKISLSDIQNKTVATQVNDIVTFPSYSPTDDLTQIKQQIKEHIKNYGAVDALIHGASPFGDSDCYNNETGAIYCDDSSTYPIDHAVVIVGWDDDYSVENFIETKQPKNNGAWIIKNSWGTGEEYTLAEMKGLIFSIYEQDLIEQGITNPSLIPDEYAVQIFSEIGFTVENNVATLKIGDNGFMYVSYEDINIYSDLTGITNAQNELTYENIYQYDNFGYGYLLQYPGSKMYMATEFDKKTTGDEYLTQVAISTAEKYTCKVYVNPNGTSKDMNNLQQVELATGESETIDVGYHTLEFAEPIKINSDSFVVVLEVEGDSEDLVTFVAEVNFTDFLGKNSAESYGLESYDNVTIAKDKCFITTEAGMEENQWENASTYKNISQGQLPNFDTTIKAFTTSKVLESIRVTTPPTKTQYIIGQDFDATGMVVEAVYTDGTSKVITDYDITNGTELMLDQTSVIIVYERKTVEQPIEVVENKVEEIKITTPPTKTEYFAGEDFDSTGMVVKAIYTDKTEKQITDFVIEDGECLLNAQTSVTISYEGKTTTQEIVVNENNVTKLEITQEPKKIDYVVGQNFEPEGMIVKATYENGLEKNVTNYTIQNGTNLTLEQEYVVIEFEGQTVNQNITVVEKSITSISVKTMPTKTEYLLNEELDLTGGEIEVLYNDGTRETLKMTSEEITVTGFESENIGTITITLTYENKTVQIEVNVKELEKPENSNLENVEANLKSVKSYLFTDENKEEYIVMNVEINNMIKSTVNDELEYYYYLSATPNEENIANWVKINETQNEENKIQFEINTKDISNFEEIHDAEMIYIYVKEVAIRNNMKSEKVSNGLMLNIENASVENYVDGVKTEIKIPGTDSTPGQATDDTKAPGTIPNAGKSIFTIILITIVLIIGRISYKKYKDIEIK